LKNEASASRSRGSPPLSDAAGAANAY